MRKSIIEELRRELFDNAFLVKMRVILPRSALLRNTFEDIQYLLTNQISRHEVLARFRLQLQIRQTLLSP